MAMNRWSREQLVVAFALYCRTSFGKMHKGNPEIVRLARIVGRTPSSLAMKLVNFASLDPAITGTGRKGLGNASAEDRRVRDEFHADWDRLAMESARFAQSLGDAEAAALAESRDELTEDFAATDRQAWVEVRTKQAFFRSAVLGSYRSRCCMSGLAVPALLVASHIVPWKSDPKNRLNPRNGLCLSALHDRAFDRGLITVTPKLTIMVSKRLGLGNDESFLAESLLELNGKRLEMPEKFAPERRFLEHHVERIFKG